MFRKLEPAVMKLLKGIRNWLLWCGRVFAREWNTVLHDQGVLVFFVVLPIIYPVIYTLIYNPEVLRDMKVNGAQRSKFTRFMKDVRDQVNKGIPLFWGVTLGTYPEPESPQSRGGHIRLIIGYNDRKKEILYTDTWGAGHELKRMPAEWAWTISHCLLYMKPLR